MNALETTKGKPLLTVSEMSSAMDQHRGILRHWASLQVFMVSPQEEILPEAEIERIEAEIAAFRTSKCRQDRALAIVTRLAMSYPQSAGENPEAARAYIASAAGALTDYPEAIGHSAANAILRRSRFRPSVAEIVEEADRLVNEATDGATSAVWKMRDQQAKRAKKAEEETRRKAEYEIRSAETEAAVLGGLARAGVKPGDVKHAGRVLDYRRMDELLRAAKAGEDWAAIPLRAAALLSRIHIAVIEHRADYRAALAVAEVLSKANLTRAEKLVAAAESAPEDPDAWRARESGRDPRHCGVFWTEIRKIASPALKVLADDIVYQRSEAA